MARTTASERPTWTKRPLGRRNVRSTAGLFIGLWTTSLLDATVATVGQQAITLNDLRAAYAVTQSLDRGVLHNRPLDLSDSKLFEETREQAIRTMLVRNYLENIGSLNRSDPTELADLQRSFEALFPSPEARKNWYSKMGIDETLAVRAIESRERDRRFQQLYLLPRVSITTGEMERHYQEKKDSRFLGKPFKSVEALVRADLRREKLRDEFERWLETEKRRTEITLLPPPSVSTP